MEITKDILYAGVNDHDVDLFEGHYIVPDGMAYNSYVIADEKVAVMDSVDAHFADEWIGNVKALLGDKTPDYLVVQHMEPDHSGSIRCFLEAFPDAQVVSSQKAFGMMKNFFEGEDYADRRVIVKEGDVLDLGSHKLNFVAAPMVHWPEVLMTYDSTDKVLFSADGFGKFGALDVCGETGADDDDWACEPIYNSDEVFTWKQDDEWDEVLEDMIQILLKYMNEGKYADQLKENYKAIAVGFVDGDLELLYEQE